MYVVIESVSNGRQQYFGGFTATKEAVWVEDLEVAIRFQDERSADALGVDYLTGRDTWLFLVRP